MFKFMAGAATAVTAIALAGFFVVFIEPEIASREQYRRDELRRLEEQRAMDEATAHRLAYWAQRDAARGA